MARNSRKKILVFTGGGVAPALNPTLFGVIESARSNGWEIMGGLYGWASLLRNGKIINLGRLDIKSLKDTGGTFLRSSRTNPFGIPDGLDQVKEKIKELEIDAVVAIGGDDTLGAALKLFRSGLPIVGVPKTIDNDLSGTYFSPGFASAAHYLANFVDEIKKDAAYALSRIFVVESMGMHSGWLTLSSIYGYADVILPPEREISISKVLDLTRRRYEENGNFAVVVVAQEAHFDELDSMQEDIQIGDQYGYVRKSFVCVSLKDKIKKELGIESKALYPGNFLETGNPIPMDRDLAIKLGQKAIELVKEEKFGYMPTIVRPEKSKTDLKIDTISLDKVAGEKNHRKVPAEYYDMDKLMPTQKFLDYMEPILGKYKSKNDQYLKLIHQIKRLAT